MRKATKKSKIETKTTSKKKEIKKKFKRRN